MQGYLSALTIVLFLGMVLTRVYLLRRAGTRAMHFGRIDKTDFLIPRSRSSTFIPCLPPPSIFPTSAPGPSSIVSHFPGLAYSFVSWAWSCCYSVWSPLVDEVAVAKQ